MSNSIFFLIAPMLPEEYCMGIGVHDLQIRFTTNQSKFNVQFILNFMQFNKLVYLKNTFKTVSF